VETVTGGDLDHSATLVRFLFYANGFDTKRIGINKYTTTVKKNFQGETV